MYSAAHLVFTTPALPPWDHATMALSGVSVSSTAVTALLLSTVVFVLYTAIYRLLLNPLARFPGPKFAAVTKAYQFYFDVVKRGKLPWELARLHAKYGELPHQKCFPAYVF